MPADADVRGPVGGDASGEAVFEELRDLDRLVHEPARLMILAYLFVTDSADFVFLARQTGLTLGNLSSHVSKLEEAGYVEVQKSFKGKRPNTQLRLTEPGRKAFAEYRERIERALRDLPEIAGPHDSPTRR
ncbi:MAG: transcriptional regulator [Gemmatimonadota bacterium]|nr:transcriptional regulator [Gemmatimonadota bacterium]MDH4350018.1 transcriptional regulator [Gemmatimonadota bacterium]MDH5196395.1 transcriptional regulator [Gemmatimonadota bacterium]